MVGWLDVRVVKLCPWAHLEFSSGDGRLSIRFQQGPISKWFHCKSRRIAEPTPPDAQGRIPLFDLPFWPTFARLYTTHWLLTVLAGSLALAPWCPTRFSLSTLFVAMTVMAAITGLIAWVDRTF